MPVSVYKAHRIREIMSALNLWKPDIGRSLAIGFFIGRNQNPHKLWLLTARVAPHWIRVWVGFVDFQHTICHSRFVVKR